jgi:uncharacterized protein YndB with AHSA1/START domain
MSERFVYVTYIQSTPEQVWDALIDPEMTREYWGVHRNRSDWKPGSQWRHEDYDDPNLVHVTGIVVESDRPHRLVLTWKSLTTAAQEESKVTFLIEGYSDAVRLTVVHDELLAGSETLKGVSSGWPAILSSLKSLLETGQAMPMTRKRWAGKTGERARQ